MKTFKTNRTKHNYLNFYFPTDNLKQFVKLHLFSQEDLLNKLPDNNLKFDLTSCQFAIHYSFESEKQAHRMVKNACQSLKEGGYFIGTTVDSTVLRFVCMNSFNEEVNIVSQSNFDDVVLNKNLKFITTR